MCPQVGSSSRSPCAKCTNEYVAHTHHTFVQLPFIKVLSNSQLEWLTCLKLAAMKRGLLLPKLRLPYSEAHDKANSETHKGMKTPLMQHRISCCCKTSSLVFALTTGDCQQEGAVKIFHPNTWHSFDL